MWPTLALSYPAQRDAACHHHIIIRYHLHLVTILVTVAETRYYGGSFQQSGSWSLPTFRHHFLFTTTHKISDYLSTANSPGWQCWVKRASNNKVITKCCKPAAFILMDATSLSCIFAAGSAVSIKCNESCGWRTDASVHLFISSRDTSVINLIMLCSAIYINEYCLSTFR